MTAQRSKKPSDIGRVPERVYFLDWLRVLLILVLIFSHTLMIFWPRDYFIKNDDTSDLINAYAVFVYQWYIAFFFFIAGASTSFALVFRTKELYVKERIKRLFIPFIFGVLIILPPMVYLERVHKKEFHGSYLEFYPHLFNGIYPEGNFGWHHLYFIIELFLFSLIMLPLFLFLKKEQSKIIICKLTSLSERKGFVVMSMMPFVIIRIILGGINPILDNLIEDISSSHSLF
ncbi:MAG: acyltransferase family protein, partial [Promethearchaeota archaeon]